MEGTPWNSVISPLDDDHVVALLPHSVGDIVEAVAHMLHIYLFTRSPRAVHTDHQHVSTWTMSGEKVSLVPKCLCTFMWRVTCLCVKLVIKLFEVLCIFLDGYLTCFAAIHAEGVLLAHQGFGEAWASAHHLAGVRRELGGRCSGHAAAGQGAVAAGHLGGLGDRLHQNRGGLMQAVAS